MQGAGPTLRKPKKILEPPRLSGPRRLFLVVFLWPASVGHLVPATQVAGPRAALNPHGQMPVPPSRATRAQRRVERRVARGYLPFFFLAAFFFFLATVNPPLKVRQPAVGCCNQCSAAESHRLQSRSNHQPRNVRERVGISILQLPKSPERDARPGSRPDE